MGATNDSIYAIIESVAQIAKSMEHMQQSTEDSTENSQAVMNQMQELFRLSELLNQTVASFQI